MITRNLQCLSETHENNGLAKDARKDMKELNYGAKTVDQFPISVPIFFERFCAVLK